MGQALSSIIVDLFGAADDEEILISISLQRAFSSYSLFSLSKTKNFSDQAEVFYETFEALEVSVPTTPSIFEHNFEAPCERTEGQREKISKGVTIEERWIKHYSSRQKILLVGEGDFSFSASLAVAFGSANNMTATSLNPKWFLKKNYEMAMPNIQTLKERGCIVIHEVDATDLANHSLLNGMKFDCIIFNFPLAGFFRKESREYNLQKNRDLIDGFLTNAKEMINTKGEIHITHKTIGFFLAWDVQGLASSRGLKLKEQVHFDVADYPGYRTKYGFGGDECFDHKPSKTYKFKL